MPQERVATLQRERLAITLRPDSHTSVTVPFAAATGGAGKALAFPRRGFDTTVGADHAPAAYLADHTPEDPFVGLLPNTATTDPSAVARPANPVMIPLPDPDTRCAGLTDAPLTILDVSHEVVAR